MLSSLLAILWNSAFRYIYLSCFPLPFPSLLFSAIGSPGTFTTVQGLLWFNSSPVFWLSARLCGGAHIPGLPGLLKPVPLPPCQAAADPCLHRRPWDTQRHVWLSFLWIPGSWCAQSFLVLWAILNVISHLLPSCLGCSFAPGHGASFLVWSSILLSMVVQLLVAISEFSQECMSFYFAILLRNLQSLVYII